MNNTEQLLNTILQNQHVKSKEILEKCLMEKMAKAIDKKRKEVGSKLFKSEK